MKLFRVQFDGNWEFVEAPSMSAAIEVWHQHARAADPNWDMPETPEPDGVELVSVDPVLRAIAPTAEA